MLFEYIKLNCTKDFDCTQSERTDQSSLHIAYIVLASVGTLGILANLFSYYILSLCGDQLNTKFKDTLKIYLLNSILYCSNDVLSLTIWLATTTIIYETEAFIYQLYLKYEFMIYFVYIRLNLGSLSYVFGGFMDIYMTWGRIQIFKPAYNFLRYTSVKKVCLWLLISAFILSIPNAISREALTVEFNLTVSNTSISLHTYTQSRFEDSEIFVATVLVANFMRSVVPMVIEISLDIMLVFFFGRYVIKRARLTGSQDQALSSVERTNMRITLILSFLSIIVHLFHFLTYLSKRVSLPNKLVSNIQTVAGLSGTFKHTINFFIFFALNKEFSQKVLNLF